MPARVIRGEINASRSLARVSMEAELAFRALITAVDDYGRCDADPLMLKAALFPRRTNVRPEMVAQWVAELAEAPDAPVMLYEVEGLPYLCLTGWERHRGNARRAASSRFPAPPAQPTAPLEAPGGCEQTPRFPGDSRKSGTAREMRGEPPENRESGVGIENRESRASGKPRATARSPAAPAAWAMEGAEGLRESVRRRWPGAPVPGSLTAWARDLERIKAGAELVQEALRWYIAPDRDGDRYLPECRSGRAFREKYDKVLAARKRVSGAREEPASRKPRRYYTAPPRTGGIENFGSAIGNLLRDAGVER